MFNKRHPGRGACAYFFSPQFKYAVVCIIVFVRIKSHWLLKLCKASWMNWRLRLYRNESFFSGLQMLRWSTFTSTSSPMPRSETKPGFHISIYSTEEYLISYWRWCCIPADCFGTTTILIIGPTFVACDSAKLITLKSFSFAMFTKLSFRLDKAGESWQKWKMLVNNYPALTKKILELFCVLTFTKFSDFYRWKKKVSDIDWVFGHEGSMMRNAIEQYTSSVL